MLLGNWAGISFMSKYPRKSSVIGILFNEKRDRVLLIKRRDVPIWVLPGGGIEENETSEEAIVREIWEETGLEITIKRKVAEYFPINRLTRLTHVFECIKTAGEPITGTETVNIGFYPLNDLPQPFFFLHLEWLHDAKKDHSQLIQNPINQITYLKLCRYFFLHPIQVIRIVLSRLGIPINAH
jgi:8-oxo-dGTP diphosphatase